jgi:hypothetical protein
MSAGYFRYYYFVSLAAPLTVLAALAIEHFLKAYRVAWPAAAVAVMLVIVAYPLSEHVRRRAAFDEAALFDKHMLVLARSLAEPGTTTFFGDLNPELYALTGTVPATRYPQAVAHVFAAPALFGVDAVAELKRVFARRPVLVMARAERLAPGSKYGSIIGPLLADYVPVPVEDDLLKGQILIYRLAE